MYRIPINYSCFMGWRSINQDMHSFGLLEDGQNFGFRQTITLTMTLPTIPSQEKIAEYGKVIQDEYNKTEGEFDIVSINFESFGAIEELEDSGNEK